MDIAMIGLGKMGANMAARLLRGGHRVVVFDLSEEAIELGVPLPVISLALQRRFRSREEVPFADKLLAALRNQFGGHAITSPPAPLHRVERGDLEP